ncbi:MAG: hypothetical protein JO098_04915 [Candidatus Eremiobacteraeota bacterium]|nr:hypothetical protein [Candidatus Eremiobacteraeota bacterium]
MSLPPMPQSAAEAALVDLWILLEEHGLSTPNLSFTFEANNDVRKKLITEDSLPAITFLRAWVEEYERRHVKEAASAALHTSLQPFYLNFDPASTDDRSLIRIPSVLWPKSL